MDLQGVALARDQSVHPPGGMLFRKSPATSQFPKVILVNMHTKRAVGLSLDPEVLPAIAAGNQTWIQHVWDSCSSVQHACRVSGHGALFLPLPPASWSLSSLLSLIIRSWGVTTLFFRNVGFLRGLWRTFTQALHSRCESQKRSFFQLRFLHKM